MKSITVDLKWTKGPMYRTRVVAGMQIKAWKRETEHRYWLPNHNYEYRIIGSGGVEICFGFGITLFDIKKVSTQALAKRI